MPIQKFTLTTVKADTYFK